MTRDRLLEQLMQHEGHGPMKNGRFMPYKDSKGILTIGYGRNLEANGVRESEAGEMLNNDLDEAIHACFADLLWFRSLDTVRQSVVSELVFSMGMATFLTFPRMIAAIERRDFPSAAHELRTAKWYRDVKAKRGDKVCDQLGTGIW
jgi:lysozyme